MAEDERKRIKERQEEGIKVAISKGVKFGRKKIDITETFISAYNDWKQNNIRAVESMKKTNMKSNTFYRRVKEYETTLDTDVTYIIKVAIDTSYHRVKPRLRLPIQNLHYEQVHQ